jgi:hypothetical protein
MPKSSSQKAQDREVQVRKALYAYIKNEFNSIRATTKFFNVPETTLRRRYHKGLTQSTSHEMYQILINAEEDTLVRWIKRYTSTRTHITNTLLKELALQLRAARVTHASHLFLPHPQLDRINNKWLLRFQKRHPEVGGIYTHQLKHIRKDGATYEHVERWFRAVALKFEEYHYKLEDV